MKKTCSRGHTFEKTGDCPICPYCWPRLKRKLLEGGDLPARLGAPALRALDRVGIRWLAQVAGKTEQEISALHGVGPKSRAALKLALRAKKLSFKKR